MGNESYTQATSRNIKDISAQLTFFLQHVSSSFGCGPCRYAKIECKPNHMEKAIKTGLLWNIQDGFHRASP